MTRTLRWTISYDGGGFAGSQVQPGVRTVQGDLEHVWAVLTGREERLTLAGRTDAGVHARGQVASLETECAIPLVELRRSVTTQLPPDLRLDRLEEAAPGFDARRDARWRRYRYDLPVASRAAPRYVAVPALAQACTRLLGEQDFAALASSAETGPRGTVRRVLRARVRRTRTHLVVVFVGDAFLRQMVRRAVAALLSVGSGRITEFEFDRALRLRERAVLPGPAPAGYLTLVGVGYGEYTG